MQPVIETHDLSRRFGKKEAVRGLNLSVPRGSVFAFIGPNGAGKTTTILMLMNILEPTRGEAIVLGKSSLLLGPQEFAQIGYVSENQKLPSRMTVAELLAYCRPLYPSWDDGFCERLLRAFRLPADEKIRNLSRGMRVKLALLTSLVYHPRLLVLDEPFGGLDPLVRDELIRGILELSEEHEWTVFVSSHDIDEVERLADWVAFLNSGELAFAEPVAGLQARFRKVEVVTRDDGRLPASLPPNWLNVERSGRTIRFTDAAYAETVTENRIRSAFPDSRFDILPMSLRETFVALARTYQLSGASQEALR